LLHPVWLRVTGFGAPATDESRSLAHWRRACPNAADMKR